MIGEAAHSLMSMDFSILEMDELNELLDGIERLPETSDDSILKSTRYCLLTLLAKVSQSLQPTLSTERISVLLGEKDPISFAVACQTLSKLIVGKDAEMTQSLFKVLLNKAQSPSLSNVAMYTLVTSVTTPSLAKCLLELPPLEEYLAVITIELVRKDSNTDAKPFIKLLASSLMLVQDIKPETHYERLYSCLDSWIDSAKPDWKFRALVSFGILCQCHPSLCLYMGSQENWIDRVMVTLQSLMKSTRDFDMNKVLEYVLMAASECCRDGPGRLLVSKYSKVIGDLVENGDGNVKSLAAVILIKLMSEPLEPSARSETQDTVLEALKLELCRDSDSNSLSSETTLLPKDESHNAAIEGLAYLSAIPTLKAKMVSDSKLVSTLGSMVSKYSDRASLYGIAIIFMNLIKYAKVLSAEEQQLIKLKAMSMGKAPQKSVLQVEQELCESDASVAKRVQTLMDQGFPSILQSLCKVSTGSTCNETLSRIFLSIVTTTAFRLPIVKGVGVRFLIGLASGSLENTEEGITMASQALAKITLSSDPALVFPGQSGLDAIRPLTLLVPPTQHPLLQFEGLMALTNLTSIDDVYREKVFTLLNVFSWIEEGQIYTASDEGQKGAVMIRRASTQLICNLVYFPPCFELYLDSALTHHRFDLLVAYSSDSDLDTRLAASGILATLSSGGPEAVQVFIHPKRRDKVVEMVTELIQEENTGLAHRGFEICFQMLSHSNDVKGLAKSFAVSGLLSPLFDIAKSSDKSWPGPEIALAILSLLKK